MEKHVLKLPGNPARLTQNVYGTELAENKANEIAIQAEGRFVQTTTNCYINQAKIEELAAQVADLKPEV